MPNPLSLATATPTTPEKAATSRHLPDQKTGSESFQDVLGQEVESTDVPDDENSAIVAENTDIEAEAAPVSVTTPEATVTAHPVPETEQTVELQTSSTIDENTGMDLVTLVPVQFAAANHSPITTSEQSQTAVSHGLPPRDVPPLPIQSNSQGEQTQNATPQPAQMKGMTENGRVFDQLTKPKSKVAGTEATPVFLNTEKTLPAKTVTLTPKPPTPDHAPSVTQLQLMATAVESEPAAPVIEVEALHAAGEDPLPLTTREPVSQLAAPPTAIRAEIARAIAGQLAATIQTRAGSGAIEIALNPEELGRVSIVLNGREDGLHMTIAIERPETLELMRRHLAVLTEELQKLGYGDLSFDLGTSWDSGAYEKATDDADTHAPLHSERSPSKQVAQTTPIPRILASGRGIDMRF